MKNIVIDVEGGLYCGDYIFLGFEIFIRDQVIKGNKVFINYDTRFQDYPDNAGWVYNYLENLKKIHNGMVELEVPEGIEINEYISTKNEEMPRISYL